MFAVDLWRLPKEEKQHTCAAVLQNIRNVAMTLLTGSQKISLTLTPDSFIVEPPPAAPPAFHMDEEDGRKLQELTALLSWPHVRLCLPYCIWKSMQEYLLFYITFTRTQRSAHTFTYFVALARKESYHEVPHWSGGTFAGWVLDGMPHKHARLTMLMPTGSMRYDGEFHYGQLHGDGTLEVLDLELRRIFRYQGQFQDNKRSFGVQEWFENDVLSKSFRGKWVSDQPTEGVWQLPAAEEEGEEKEEGE